MQVYNSGEVGNAGNRGKVGIMQVYNSGKVGNAGNRHNAGN